MISVCIINETPITSVGTQKTTSLDELLSPFHKYFVSIPHTSCRVASSVSVCSSPSELSFMTCQSQIVRTWYGRLFPLNIQIGSTAYPAELIVPIGVKRLKLNTKSVPIYYHNVPVGIIAFCLLAPWPSVSGVIPVSSKSKSEQSQYEALDTTLLVVLYA